MNDQRRNQLADLMKKVEAFMTAIEGHDIEDIASDLERTRDDEQTAFDNMPPSLQNGERGQDSEHAIEQMGEALDKLESLRDALEGLSEVVGLLDEAKAAGKRS